MKPYHAALSLIFVGLFTSACDHDAGKGSPRSGSGASRGPVYTASVVKFPPKGAPMPPPAPTPPAPPPVAPSPAGPPDNSMAVRQQIVDGVTSHFPEIRKCYDDVTGPAAANGRVVVRFLVAPSGDVVETADEGSTMADKTVVSCIVNVFGRMKFATFDGSAVPVVYPIEFTMSPN